MCELAVERNEHWTSGFYGGASMFDVGGVAHVRVDLGMLEGSAIVDRCVHTRP